MSNSEISEKIWNAKVCCKVNYPQNSCTGAKTTFYLLINRNSYLYLQTPLIFEYFDIPISKLNQVSFQDVSNGEFVNWSIPVDIAYQASNVSNNDYFDINLVLGISPSIPIRMFQQQLANFEDVSMVLEKYWRNMVKESCFILNGSSNIVMAMSLDASKDFWSAVVSCESSRFDKHFRKIAPKSPKNVPLKLHFVEGGRIIRSPLLSMYTLFPNRSLHEITLQDIVNSQVNYSTFRIFVHGVEIPMVAPIAELYSVLKYFDAFLHIVVKVV